MKEAAAPQDDRTSRHYQGVSRAGAAPVPQGAPVQARSPYASTASVPVEHPANAPSKANARPNPAVRRTVQAAAEPVEEGETVFDTDAEEFCAVPETHGHEGVALDDMEARRRRAAVPTKEEMRRAVIWSEILGSRGGRRRPCRL